MGFKKIYIALDCKDAEEAQRMQKAAEHLSSTFGMSASDILEVYPYVIKNAGLIKSTIKTLSRDGIKGLGSIVASMMKNFRR